MQIILVDGKAWERHRSAFADFIYRIERLKLSARTLQEYRSRGLLAFYKIGGKILL